METEVENENPAEKPDIDKETTETNTRVNENAILALKDFIDFLEEMKFEYLKSTDTNNDERNSVI